MTEIREELPTDVSSIREVNTRAFGRDQEANIVDALRSNGAVLLSLVAVKEERVVGHIMYSQATIGEVSGAALGPMAVVPERQRHGVGGELVRTGTERLRNAGCPFIIVVGHPAFYPRFGFQPASDHGISCEWGVPDEAFMLIVLDESLMRLVSGRALYRQEFSTAS